VFALIVCVLLPRFQLAVAAGARAGLLQKPAALAPEPGREQQVGEVSPAAEAYGIHPGMRLGEALARCPLLALVPPDPAGVVEAWEAVLTRLEGIGAGVESERPGFACFDARGLRRLHGGLDGVLTAVRRALRAPEARGDAARSPVQLPARIGAGPSRFCALAAAARARPRRPVVVTGEARDYLASLPVSLLRAREETAELPVALERLGVRTLGELAALPPDALADRFGAAGVLAHDLASGLDRRPIPRPPAERVIESLDLPEAASGPQLEQALGLLIDRLLARSERRGRTLRAVTLSATLVEGGTWRERVTFREALADPRRMRLALVPKLVMLPAPAELLRVIVERFGPPGGDQRALLDQAAAVRRSRLREGVRQARAAAGQDAALRVLPLEPDSRVPERRAALTPFEG
jgi:nucleotidyltransferase/DNA polymerase involved in DNA repair